MEKDYFNHLYNLDALGSGMLGSFDSDNSYIIDPSITQELIACKKTITSFDGDKIEATANIGVHVIKFNVYIQLGEENKKRAGLFVAEKSKFGFIEKEIQTYVDSVVLENNGAFFDEVKKKYNLYTADESMGIDMSNGNLKSILQKIEGSLQKYKIMIPVLMDLDKMYVAKMMMILKEAGHYGKVVLDMLKNDVSKIGTSKIDAKYWREVKLALDKILVKHIELFDTTTIKKIETLQKEYASAYKSAKEPVKQATSKPKKKSAGKKKDLNGGLNFNGGKPSVITFGSGKKSTEKPKAEKTQEVKKTPPQKPAQAKPMANQSTSASMPQKAMDDVEAFGFRLVNEVQPEKNAEMLKKEQRDLGMER